MSSSKPFLDVNALRQTQEAVRNRPALGKVTFKIKGHSKGGLVMASETGPLVQDDQADQSRAGKFTLISDEPVALLGTDTGVNPAEYALQALAGCYTVTLASLAAARGVDLDKIELDLSFHIDLNGFLGLDDRIRKGAQAISIDIKLASSSSDRAVFEELVRELPSHSPIHDTLANPVKVTARLV